MKIALCAAVLIAALLTATLLASAAQEECSAEDSRFGVVAHLSWAFFYRTPEEIAQGMAMMRAAGIRWVRLNWAWKDFQPVPGAFDFGQFDTVAALAEDYGIRLLPILMGIPQWASTAPEDLKAARGDMAPVDRYRPEDPTDWLHYVRTVVERYDGDGIADAPGSPRIDHWEVWNEPNLAWYWPPAPDATEYVAWLAMTHDAIRSADPAAIVVLGGLSGSGVNPEGTGFLQQIYAAGGADYFDVASVHHYLHPLEGSVAQLQTTLEATRWVMDAHGDEEKPLWLTEIGWSDALEAWGRPTATQAAIADWLAAVYSAPLPVEKIFWYNFRNIDVTGEVEHNFGLVTREFEPKPAYHAYQALTRQACA